MFLMLLFLSLMIGCISAAQACNQFRKYIQYREWKPVHGQDWRSQQNQLMKKEIEDMRRLGDHEGYE
jgi:hypothetical protein